MSKRVIQFLKDKGIDFEVREYLHEEKGARFASSAMGFPIEKTIKTLVVDVAAKGDLLVLMPGDCKLNLKQLAKLLGSERAAMVDKHTAECLTGYLLGGISPFCTKTRLPVVMEENLLEHDKVAVNAGQRGVMLIISPRSIVSVTNCQILKLSRE